MKDYIEFKDKDNNIIILAKDKFVCIAIPSALNPINTYPNVWATSPTMIPVARVSRSEVKNIKVQLGIEDDSSEFKRQN